MDLDREMLQQAALAAQRQQAENAQAERMVMMQSMRANMAAQVLAGMLGNVSVEPLALALPEAKRLGENAVGMVDTILVTVGLMTIRPTEGAPQ